MTNSKINRISLQNDWFSKIYRLFDLTKKEKEKKDKPIYYRNQLGKYITYNNKKIIIPKRLNENTSKTKDKSQELEDEMSFQFAIGGNNEPFSDKHYDIPFIEDKKILLDGHTTSLNVIDSLAKYTSLHNVNPQLTRSRTNLAKTTKPVDVREIIGLLHESYAGATPWFNGGSERYTNRELANTNYFTAFGYIPAEALVRDWSYKYENDKSLPPLLDAIRRYAEGDYNRGMSKTKSHTVHTRRTLEAANRYLENKQLKEYLYNLQNIYPNAFLKNYKTTKRSLKYGGININPNNIGKFTATMKRTGKTAEELSHSKNPLTRKRAVFTINARKWNH